MRRLTRVLVVAGLASCAVFVAATSAGAATVAPGPSSPINVDLTQQATWVPLVAGVLVPYLVSVLTKMKSAGWVKGIVAAFCLALTALGTYLLDTGLSHTWAGALQAFALALVSAASTRVVLTGGGDAWLARKTERVGILGRARREPTESVSVPAVVSVPATATVPGSLSTAEDHAGYGPTLDAPPEPV